MLVAPLNWGLGHATRCMPLINDLLLNGNRVLIGSDGDSLNLLQKEYPQLKTFTLPSYAIDYPKNPFWFGWKMAWQSWGIRKTINKEKAALAEIVNHEPVDYILSDNRYGVYHPSAKNIFITHQLKLIMPAGWRFAENWVCAILKKYVEQFDECWVPDDEGENNLSGSLSHGIQLTIPISFIGPLSRFSKMEVQPEYDALLLLSGPEPQRSILEKLWMEQIMADKDFFTAKRLLLIRGLPQSAEQIDYLPHSVRVVNYANSDELNQYALASGKILCRAGYSTIMDLKVIEKTAVLVPTPGQTEQLYLAQHLASKGIGAFVQQDRINLKVVLSD